MNLSLPQIESGTPRRGDRLRRWLLHAYRVAALALIILLIHQQHRWYLAQQRGALGPQTTVEHVRDLYPSAAALTAWDPKHDSQTVVNAKGEPLGYVVQTLPAAEHIVGYSGPTNTLVAFGADDRILAIKVLYSGDTPEHLADAVADRKFMATFNGLTWREASEHSDVDAVSGATLTSMSIAEGVIHRLGGVKPPSRFPEAITLDEARAFFPPAHELVPVEAKTGVFDVADAQGQRLGVIARTSPITDDEIGYQGPTDSLVAMDMEQHILGIVIRGSYDNEPYVSYVKEDEYFLNTFKGMKADDLATLDLAQAGIDGVSGATKTSTAVIEAQRRLAQYVINEPAKPTRRFSFAARDFGTMTVVVLALVIAFTPLRGNRKLRIAFQIVLVAYLGFVNGDMVSQGLLAGWAQSGVPWRLAPGLAVLSLAALLTPIVTRRQVYCSHICPHGAAQDWLRRRIARQFVLPRRVSRVLRMLPAALLLVTVLVAMRHWRFSLINIEPFDAYVIRVAGWATIAIAVVGLIASLFTPMAYCRFGCPTGALLNFLHRRSSHDRFGTRDWAALLLIVVALAMYVI